MIHILLRDNYKIEEVKNSSVPSCMLVSSNVNSNVYGGNEKIILKFHQKMRFNEFVAFDKNCRFIVGKIDEVYLKYGGMCFLETHDPKKFKVYEEHLKFLFDYEYDIDPFHNDLLLHKSTNARTVDKMLLTRAFMEKDSSIIYFLPKKEFLMNSQNYIIDTLKDKTIDDIKNMTELFDDFTYVINT